MAVSAYSAREFLARVLSQGNPGIRPHHKQDDRISGIRGRCIAYCSGHDPTECPGPQPLGFPGFGVDMDDGFTRLPARQHEDR